MQIREVAKSDNNVNPAVQVLDNQQLTYMLSALVPLKRIEHALQDAAESTKALLMTKPPYSTALMKRKQMQADVDWVVAASLKDVALAKLRGYLVRSKTLDDWQERVQTSRKNPNKSNITTAEQAAYMDTIKAIMPQGAAAEGSATAKPPGAVLKRLCRLYMRYGSKLDDLNGMNAGRGMCGMV